MMTICDSSSRDFQIWSLSRAKICVIPVLGRIGLFPSEATSTSFHSRLERLNLAVDLELGPIRPEWRWHSCQSRLHYKVPSVENGYWGWRGCAADARPLVYSTTCTAFKGYRFAKHQHQVWPVVFPATYQTFLDSPAQCRSATATASNCHSN